MTMGGLADRKQSIAQTLVGLQNSGAGQFDPVAFRFLETLHGRIEGKSSGAQASLLTKLSEALSLYQKKFEEEGEAARLLADQLEYQFPEQADVIEAMLSNHDFAGLRRLSTKLTLQKRLADSQLVALQSLTRQLSELEELSESEASGFAALIKQQEKELMADFYEGAATRKAARQPELKSIRRLRESQEKQFADDLVTQTLREKPDNPGPINPHMLAIKSLVMMRDLSPHYLNQFITHLESLFWLQENSD